MSYKQEKVSLKAVWLVAILLILNIACVTALYFGAHKTPQSTFDLYLLVAVFQTGIGLTIIANIRP